MTTYLCSDGHAELQIEADSAQEAAQEYVDGGSWGDIDRTTWINVRVREICPDESIKISIDPDEPSCTEENDEHDWQSPFDVVGGIEENPGVWGKGGGVTIKEVCAHCAAYRNTDTWATDPATGEQGLRSVSYAPADEESQAWLDAKAND